MERVNLLKKPFFLVDWEQKYSSLLRKIMYILIIETSGSDSFVALCKESKILTVETLPEKEQSKCLFRGIKKCLGKENLKLKDLDCIHIGNGPGSFTGTRVGVMAAKALSFANNTPLIVSCSLERFSVPVSGPFTIALSAKSKGFYTLKGEKTSSGVQFYGPPSLFSQKELKILKSTTPPFLSPDTELLQKLNSNIECFKTSIDIAFMAEMASLRLKRGETCTHSEVKTWYLYTP